MCNISNGIKVNYHYHYEFITYKNERYERSADFNDDFITTIHKIIILKSV